MGTALATLWARREIDVRLWGRASATLTQMQHTRENARYLPGIRLPPCVAVTADAQSALADVDLIVAAIPSAFLRDTLAKLGAIAPASVPVVSVVKGIETGTFARPTEIIAATLGERSMAVLSGPSHAEEFARSLPASVVVAGSEQLLCQGVQSSLNSATFRVYTNSDAIGVELAGALKNVLGIAAGICEGLGFGDNAKSALITRGLAEIARFVIAHGGQASTLYGLAGVGDIVTTCFSPYGRNRAVGLRVGRGESIDAIVGSMTSIAEGVTTVRGVVGKADRLGIDMPIAREVYQILYEGKTPAAALADLMLRPPKMEWS